VTARFHAIYQVSTTHPLAALVAEALEKNPELGGSAGHKATHRGGFGSKGVA
jgi:hypothetical protein